MQLTIESTIAAGGQGLICLTTYEGKKVAMKIDHSVAGRTGKSGLKNEFNFLARFDHENIVKVYKFFSPYDDIKVILPTEQVEKFVKTCRKIKFYPENDHFVLEKRAIMLMELCEGELFDLVEKEKGINDMIIVEDFFVQICNGVKALHDAGLVNYDLKMENILIDSNKTLKLCDFGFTQAIDRVMVGECGTDNAMAPEMHAGPFRGTEIDIFALGVLLFTMVFAHFPWNYTRVAKS